MSDAFTTTSPLTSTLFQLRLTRSSTVTVDTLRVRFTTTGGVSNGDVTAGALWEDTNTNGTWDDTGGGDTLIQGSIAPAGGVLTFGTNFSPAATGTTYFVRATVSDLASGDTTTWSMGLDDLYTVEDGVPEYGSVTDATHAQDYSSGGDIYYSVGTSTADLKTGSPTIAISGGLATLSVAQTGHLGVGDVIVYGANEVYSGRWSAPPVRGPDGDRRGAHPDRGHRGHLDQTHLQRHRRRHQPVRRGVLPEHRQPGVGGLHPDLGLLQRRLLRRHLGRHLALVRDYTPSLPLRHLTAAGASQVASGRSSATPGSLAPER